MHAHSAVQHDSSASQQHTCPARRTPDSPSQTQRSSSKVKITQSATVGGGIQAETSLVIRERTIQMSPDMIRYDILYTNIGRHRYSNIGHAPVIVLRLTVYVWLDAKLCGLWPVCQLIGLPRLLLQLTQPSVASLPHSPSVGDAQSGVHHTPPALPTACRAVATVVMLTLINAHRPVITASPHCLSSFSV